MTAVSEAPGPAADDGLVPQRAAEIVELSEILYRKIFGSGMVVATFMGGLAVALSAAQPSGSRLSGAVASAVLAVACGVVVNARARAYAALRTQPWLILAAAAAVGGGAWLAGTENQQLFYVVTLVLGVMGLAVPFTKLFAATVVAAIGTALPQLLATHPALTSTAIATLTVPTIFWLIIERLARYMLRTNELTTSTAPASGVPDPARDDAAGFTERRRARWLPSGPSRRQLTTPREPGSSMLSARQLQAVLLCAEGLNHLQIAACLDIGPQQVRRHLRLAREATGARTSAELVAWAIRAGLLPDRIGT